MFVIQTMPLVSLANIANWYGPIAFGFPSTAFTTRLPIIGNGSHRLAHLCRDGAALFEVRRRRTSSRVANKPRVVKCKAERGSLNTWRVEIQPISKILRDKAFRHLPPANAKWPARNINDLGTRSAEWGFGAVDKGGAVSRVR